MGQRNIVKPVLPILQRLQKQFIVLIAEKNLSLMGIISVLYVVIVAKKNTLKNMIEIEKRGKFRFYI